MPRADYTDPPAELVRLGQTIRSLRKQRDLKQLELAHEAGMVESQISDLERARNNPGWLSLIRILEAMDVSISEFGAAYEQRADAEA